MMKAVGTPCLQALLALANSNLQCYTRKERCYSTCVTKLVLCALAETLFKQAILFSESNTT